MNYAQTVKVSNEYAKKPRLDAFRPYVAGKKVLHVGCTDWPHSPSPASLHPNLAPLCQQLDGFDVNTSGFPALRQMLDRDSRLFSDWSEVTESYDTVLVPEVLEHVGNAADFLRQLARVRAQRFVLTVPDAYSCFAGHFRFDSRTQVFTEVVHPGHFCWYSPYTFRNVVAEHTDWRLDGMWFVNGISLMGVWTPA